MSWIISGVALALWLASIALGRAHEPDANSSRAWIGRVVPLLGLAALFVIISRAVPSLDLPFRQALYGASAGCLGVALCLLPYLSRGASSSVTGSAFGSSLAVILTLGLPTAPFFGTIWYPIGFSFGAAVGAVSAGSARSGVIGLVLGSFAVAIFAHVESSPKSLTGSVLATLLAACVLSAAFGRPRGSPWVRVAMVCALFGVFGALVFSRGLESTSMPIAIVLASIVAALAALSEPASEVDRFRVVVYALAWIGVASSAFVIGQDEGLLAAAATAALLLGAIANSRVLASCAPLLFLAVFRVFRTIYPEAPRAIDVGQHYSLIGILVGLGALLAALEWHAARPGRNVRFSAGRMLTVASLFCLISAAVLFVGAKGSVGMLFGFGLAPLVVALSAPPVARATAAAANFLPSLSTVAAVGALTGLTISYRLFADRFEAPKAERTVWIEWLLVIAAVLFIATLALTARPEIEATREV